MKLYNIIQISKYFDEFEQCMKEEHKRIGVPLNSFKAAKLMIKSLIRKDKQLQEDYDIIINNRYYIKSINL